MYKKVFISHSRDDPNLDFFHKVFSGIPTESAWMEFENIPSPPYKGIRERLNQCDAVFVLLSEQILDKQHTANWVSFEIGLAANHLNTSGRSVDVYFFEPYERTIDFTVPYCTYYMPYLDLGFEELQYLKLIKNAPSHGCGMEVLCENPRCLLKFRLLTNVEVLRCPSCRKDFQIAPEMSAI